LYSTQQWRMNMNIEYD